MLPATKAGGPYTITASSKKNGNASLQDVLFGDVWICGGQSNMVFTVPQVRNWIIITELIFTRLCLLACFFLVNWHSIIIIHYLLFLPG